MHTNFTIDTVQLDAVQLDMGQRSTPSRPAAVMVVGGGIGGMRAALDLADSGLQVYLVEQTPCLGGRVAQLGFMFPQHDCVLCRGTPDHGYGCTRPSISPAYIHHNQHPNIEILTNTHVIDVAGQAGDFTVSPSVFKPNAAMRMASCTGASRRLGSPSSVRTSRASDACSWMP